MRKIYCMTLLAALNLVAATILELSGFRATDQVCLVVLFGIIAALTKDEA